MDTFLNMLTRGFGQLIDRLRGPLNFRLVIMPTVVTVLALRAAWKDFREGRPAFLGVLIKDPVERSRLFRSALKDIGKIFIVAIVLDTVYQVMGLPLCLPGAGADRGGRLRQSCRTPSSGGPSPSSRASFTARSARRVDPMSLLRRYLPILAWGAESGPVTPQPRRRRNSI